MGRWAVDLGEIAEGHKMKTKQITEIDGIHYEGFCLCVKGKKYVFFHCYPDNNSPMNLQFGKKK
jgi:hypothetical protein